MRVYGVIRRAIMLNLLHVKNTKARDSHSVTVAESVRQLVEVCARAPVNGQCGRP